MEIESKWESECVSKFDKSGYEKTVMKNEKKRNKRWFYYVITPTKVLQYICINWKNIILLKCLLLYLNDRFISSRWPEKVWCLYCTEAKRAKDLIKFLIMSCSPLST